MVDAGRPAGEPPGGALGDARRRPRGGYAPQRTVGEERRTGSGKLPAGPATAQGHARGGARLAWTVGLCGDGASTAIPPSARRACGTCWAGKSSSRSYSAPSTRTWCCCRAGTSGGRGWQAATARPSGTPHGQLPGGDDCAGSPAGFQLQPLPGPGSRSVAGWHPRSAAIGNGRGNGEAGCRTGARGGAGRVHGPGSYSASADGAPGPDSGGH